MKNTFGNALTVTLFGESHGAYIGATLDGLAPGLTVDMDNIRRMLSLRAPRGSISTARHEADEVQLISGVADGITTGTPLTLLIQNGDTKSGDYAAMKTVMRPSHADYPAQCKYHGFQDTRGGGHFSGRITAARRVPSAMRRCRKRAFSSARTFPAAPVWRIARSAISRPT